jgi:hypothetical protein
VPVMQKKRQPGCPCCTCEIASDDFAQAALGGDWTQDAGTWTSDDGGGGALGCVKTSSANAVLRNTTVNDHIVTFVGVRVYVADATDDARIRFCWDTDDDTWFEARYTTTDADIGTLGLYWYDGAAYSQLAGDVTIVKRSDDWVYLHMIWDEDYVGVGHARAALNNCGLGTTNKEWYDDWGCLGEEAIWCDASDLPATPTGYAVGLATGTTTGDIRFDDFTWRKGVAYCQEPNIRCHGDHVQAGTSTLFDMGKQWEQQTGTWTYDDGAGLGDPLYMIAGAQGDVILWHRNFRSFTDSVALSTTPVFDTDGDVADFIFDWRDANNYRYRRFTAYSYIVMGTTYIGVKRQGVYEVSGGGAPSLISDGSSEGIEAVSGTSHGYFVRSTNKAEWRPTSGSTEVLHLDYSYDLAEPTRWGWRATTLTGTLKIKWWDFGSALGGSDGYVFNCVSIGDWCTYCSDDDTGLDKSLSVVIDGFTGDCAAFNGTWAFTRSDWLANCVYASAASGSVAAGTLTIRPQAGGFALVMRRTSPTKYLKAYMPAGTLTCLDWGINGTELTVYDGGTSHCTGGTVTLWSA